MLHQLILRRFKLLSLSLRVMYQLCLNNACNGFILSRFLFCWLKFCCLPLFNLYDTPSLWFLGVCGYCCVLFRGVWLWVKSPCVLILFCCYWLMCCLGESLYFCSRGWVSNIT